MAQIEDVVILSVETGEAVQSVGQLRENVKEYRKQMSEAQLNSQEFTDALRKMTESQDALKRVMNEGKIALDASADGAQALGKSYNALTAEMANLKQAWRATTDEAERGKLATQIKDINDQLKEMDAATGNFQRSVGDYTNSISASFKDLAKDMPSFFGTAKKGVDDVSKSLALMGKQPIMGLVLILAPIISKITQELKDNETVLGAIKKAGEALQPVFNALTKVVEKLAGWISQAVDWFTKLLGESSGTFAAIIKGAVGVGNVILQAVITPLRTAIETVKGFGAAIGKVFKGDFSGAVAAARSAGENIGEALRKGFDVKANFAKGEEAAAAFIGGLGSDKSKVAAASAGREVAEAFRDSFDEVLAEDDAAEWLARNDAIAEAERQRVQQSIAAAQEATDAQIAAKEREVAERRALEDAYTTFEEEQAQKAKERAEATRQMWQASVTATASILGSLADIYESADKADLEAQRKSKSLRIASATISMIQGAMEAYMSAQTLPPPTNFVVGAANAATVTASGLASIAKIRSTSLDGAGSTTSSAPSFAASSPSVSMAPQPAASPATLATLGTDTQVLNSIKDQRVYILADDIEASSASRKVRVRETSF